MEQKTLKQFALLALFFFGYLFFYFFYKGITTLPWEGDSLAYHIPIAQDILSGRFFSPPEDEFGLRYYPGASEAILAMFLPLNLPLNLYNVVGWVVLAYLCYKLGERFGLDKPIALIYAVAISALPSVIRLIPTQTSDVWLAVFFTWSLFLLNKPERTLKYFFLLGLSSGLLIGTKVSGVLYAGVLFMFFFRKLLPLLALSRLVIFFIPFALTGLVWYIRNFLLTGNPFYPGYLLGLSGHPNFHLQDWQPWKTVLLTPNGLYKVLEAFNSEFLLWSIGILFVIFYTLFTLIKRHKPDSNALYLTGIGAVNLLIYFFLPSWPENLISDLRYIYPAFIPLILALFLLAKQKKIISLLVLLALFQTAAIFSYVSFYPKLILLYFIFLGILYILRKRLTFLRL